MKNNKKCERRELNIPLFSILRKINILYIIKKQSILKNNYALPDAK